MAELSKLVIVKNSGPINELGGVNGPILKPVRVSTSIIISMINSGKRVFEVNPRNTSQMIQLNRLNVYRVHFPDIVLRKPYNNSKSTTKSTETKKEEVPAITPSFFTGTSQPTEDVSSGLDTVINDEAVSVKQDVFENNKNDQNHGKKHRH